VSRAAAHGDDAVVNGLDVSFAVVRHVVGEKLGVALGRGSGFGNAWLRIGSASGPAFIGAMLPAFGLHAVFLCFGLLLQHTRFRRLP